LVWKVGHHQYENGNLWAKCNCCSATAIQSDISGIWNRSFADGYKVKTILSITARGAGASSAASRYISLDSKDLVWVPAHEFGHLLGLNDRYSETIISEIGGQLGYKRVKTVENGWPGNIVAVDRSVLESKNVKKSS
jgi:hypothetical protein